MDATLSIFGDADRPYPPNVCLVRPSKIPGNLDFLYLDESFDGKSGREKWDSAPATRFTPVRAFGVRYALRAGRIVFHRTQEGTARYSDGNVREWQGGAVEALTVRRKAAEPFYEELLAALGVRTVTEGEV